MAASLLWQSAGSPSRILDRNHLSGPPRDLRSAFMATVPQVQDGRPATPIFDPSRDYYAELGLSWDADEHAILAKWNEISMQTLVFISYHCHLPHCQVGLKQLLTETFRGKLRFSSCFPTPSIVLTARVVSTSPGSNLTQTPALANPRPHWCHATSTTNNPPANSRNMLSKVTIPRAARPTKNTTQMGLSSKLEDVPVPLALRRPL